MTPRYRADIEGLRGLAVLAVMAFHYVPALCPPGFAGVDVFFVISGFLIGGLVAEGLDRGDFSFLAFYARRCRRLLPALLLVLATGALAGWFLLLPDEYAALGTQTAAGAGFAANLLFWRQSGYFDQAAALKPLLHLWSLGVEEQFYLIFPPLLWLAAHKRWPRPWLLALAAIASFASLLYFNRVAGFYLPLSRLWEPLAGAWLATRRFQRPALFSAATLLLAVATSCCLSPSSALPFTLLPVLTAASFIAAGPQGWLNRLLSVPPARWLGRISYPLYLWHWPLLVFARLILGTTPSTPTLLALAALSLMLASLTWLAIERPIQRALADPVLAQPPAAARVTTASLLLLAAFAGGGLLIGAQGFPARWHARQAALSDLGGDNFVKYLGAMHLSPAGCPTRPPGYSGVCTTNNPGHQQFALFGDSHAQHYVPGLFGPATAAQGWLYVGAVGCPPALGIAIAEQGLDRHCDAVNRGALAILRSQASIGTVVLAGLATPYFNNAPPGPYLRDGRFRLSSAYPGPPAAQFEAGLSASVGALQVAHKRVVLLVDNPEMPFLIDDCVTRRPGRALLTRQQPQCSVPRAAVDARDGAYHAMIGRLAAEHPGLLVFDPTGIFCTTASCGFLQLGRSLYRDGDHLSPFGSRLVASRLLTWLGTQP